MNELIKKDIDHVRLKLIFDFYYVHENKRAFFEMS